MPKKIVISCGCCVVKYINSTPHILLVQPFRSKNVWGIPKGHIEHGETFQDCALRETYEETGVAPKIVMPLPTVKTMYREEIKYVRSFLALLEEDDVIKGDGENFAIEFFPIDNIPILHAYQYPMVNNAIYLINYGVLGDRITK